MRVLLLVTSFNSLSQRVAVELREWGHEVAVLRAAELSPASLSAAIHAVGPDRVVAPYLTSKIPESVWASIPCLVVHPGVPGDRGPSPLDWAILEDARRWGVTVLQANGEWDAGDVWAHEEFDLPPASKSVLYRGPVADAAVRALRRAFSDDVRPTPMPCGAPGVPGRARRRMRARDRVIDWTASAAEVQRRLRASDSAPGVSETFEGKRVYLYGGQPEARLRGRPGEVIARRGGAICRATGDGAVWITHVRPREPGGFKRPAVSLLSDPSRVPERPLPPDAPRRPDTLQDVWYEERGDVGYVWFDVYNGAFNTAVCRRLRRAVRLAKRRPTRVLVLSNAADTWSNGIDLNEAEAAADPAAATWQNLQAMNDLVREVLSTESHLVVAAVQGNAGAGGVMLALAADVVALREGVVLNPHYRTMGLFGSEYWTYLLPRRIGARAAEELWAACRPVGTAEALRLGLADLGFPGEELAAQVHACADELSRDPTQWIRRLEAKNADRLRDERVRPLESYRAAEEAEMQLCLARDDYHEARRRFVRKLAPRTPAEVSA